MSDRPDPEDTVEYQIGAHDVDTETVQTGDSEEEFIEFEMESKAVFKRLASDIYESEEAGIREPLTNASTAVIRAQEEFDLPSTQGVIEITLRRDKDGLMLVIQDNGTGISEAELTEVLSVIGRSTNRNREDLSGQFGMGFLALWMLSGLDGGFIMHSNSRKEGTEPISGVWKSGGFSRVAPETFENSLTGNQHGTRLEISLKNSIRGKDVRQWVSKYAEWCRVPVVYQEFDADGSEDFNEDYGDKKLEVALDDGEPFVVFENEHLRAVSSPDATGRVVLLDVPVTRNNRYLRGLPFTEVDVRMKKESGVIVDGPNEGMIPVSENEYREKDDKSKYIPEDRVVGTDVIMPGPTGTRDKLGKNEDFWDWLSTQLWNEYNRKAIDCFGKVSSPDDLFDLKKSELLHIVHASDELQEYNTPFEQNAKSKFGIDVTHTVAEAIRALREKVEVAERGTDPSTASNRRNKQAARVAWDAYGDGNTGSVFMGVSLNEKKTNVVWEDNDDSMVVRVDGTEKYDQYEKLGWKKLKSIKKSTIDEYDVSEETREAFVGGEGSGTVSAINNPDKRELTIHFDSRRRSNKKITAKSIKDQFSDYHNNDGARPTIGRKHPTRLILFPSNSDRSLSDHYWLSSDTTPIATCAVKVWEYLSDTPGVHHIDQYIQTARDTELKTTEGTTTVRNLPENAAVHVVHDDAIDLFRDDTVMERMAEYLVSVKFTGGYETPDFDSVVYTPITESEYQTVRPAMNDRQIVVGDITSTDVGNTNVLVNDTQGYAYARLHEWQGTSEMEQIRGLQPKLNEGGYDIVETLAELHDAGIAPHSIDSDHPLSQ